MFKHRTEGPKLPRGETLCSSEREQTSKNSRVCETGVHLNLTLSEMKQQMKNKVVKQMIKIKMVAKASQSPFRVQPTRTWTPAVWRQDHQLASCRSRSLSSDSLLLLLLLLLETVHQKIVCLIDLSSEVLVVSEQLLEVHSVLIEKHTRDPWSVFFAVSLLDCSINVISNEVVPFLAFKGIQLRRIDLWKLNVRSIACWSMVSLLLSLVASNLSLRLNVLLLIRLVLILVVASSSLTSAATSLPASS